MLRKSTAEVRGRGARLCRETRTLLTAAYPRLQGYWGNRARTRSLLGVGI